MRKVIAEANDISFGAAILLVKDGYKIQRKTNYKKSRGG